MFECILFSESKPYPLVSISWLWCITCTKFSSALRATGRENWLNHSSQDIQRVSPTGPKLLDTPAKEEALSFLKMEGKFLRQKKEFLLFGEASALSYSSLSIIFWRLQKPYWQGSKFRCFLKLSPLSFLTGGCVDGTGQMPLFSYKPMALLRFLKSIYKVPFKEELFE